MPIVIGIFVLAALGIGTNQFLKWRESEAFNKGVCICDGHFKAFPKKVQQALSGSRGYQCDNCRKTVWLSYGTDIDYKYIKSKISKRRKQKR